MASFFTREYLFFGKLIPEAMMERIGRKLTYAGVEENPLQWGGRRLSLLVLLSLIALILPLVDAIYTFENPFDEFERGAAIIGRAFSYAFVVFAVTLAMFYTHLYYLIDERVSRVEKALPDFLILVVANLRAGLPPLNAFVAASRPEFGPLSEEVKKAAKKLSGGESISIMFVELSERFDSMLFRNLVAFFDRAIRSGGRLANILESSADYVRRVEEMREEVIAITRSHVIFLAFMVIFIMPFLLSISVQYIKLVKSIPVYANEVSSLPFFSGKLEITADFIIFASCLLVVLSSFLVSLLFGIISRGQALYGVKYAPLIAILALIVFFVAQGLLAGLISQFI